MIDLIKYWFMYLRVVAQMGYGRHGEFSAYVLAILFGLWLVMPPSTLATAYPLERVAAMWPWIEQFSGAVFIVLGFAGGLALVAQHTRLRAGIAMLITTAWTWWFLLYALSPAWPSVATLFLGLMAVLSCWASLRIPHSSPSPPRNT